LARNCDNKRKFIFIYCFNGLIDIYLLVKLNKITREEINNISDLDWIREVPSFLPGKYFDADSVCFNGQGSDCEVNIGDDETVFSLDYEDWRDKMSEGFGDSVHIIEPLLEDPNYSNNTDYYDFDTDEFNYAGHNMTSEQTERLQKIVNLFFPDIDIEDYKSDNFYNLRKYLNNQEIKSYWENLVYDYLNIIGYKVQENRWDSIANYYRDRTLGSSNTFNFPVKFKKFRQNWSDTIEITLSTKDLTKILEKNVVNNDLSKALNELSSIVTNPNWHDWFYEDWDTRGAEDDIKDAFDKFLDNTEEYIEENSEEIMEQKQLYDTLQKLGFELNYSNDWVKDIPDGGMWVVYDINFEEGKLRLDKHSSKNRWEPVEQKNKFVIKFEDLPSYLSQYRMDI